MYLQRITQRRFPVPIIVIGNLTVGGVGKTPLVIAVARALQAKGLRVGIVSRGYGAKGPFPREVSVDDAAHDVGDEPLLIRKKVGCPVVIAPRRIEAVNHLLQYHKPQVIVSDDGLQHYEMGRAIEIVVIDGVRGLGNALMLPAGPLREPSSRLKTVDCVVVNGGEWPLAHRMNMAVGGITRLVGGEVVHPESLNQPLAAVAAIGHPERFYQTLSELGLVFHPYSFKDHYAFKPRDLMLKETHIIMTEKDAVKCLPFATENMYVLSVTAELDNQFWDMLWEHKQLQEVLTV